jgi:2-dehydropantoate 2-reductase
MRVAVIGTGAVGGYFGAKLALAGHEVSFVARGGHLRAMQEKGLIVRSFQEDFQVRQATFTDRVEHIGRVDLVLFCVKSYDTEDVAKSLAPLIGAQTTILSLQNGIDNPDKITGICGTNNALAGVVYIGAQVSQPGTIKHSTGGRILFGELDGRLCERTEAVEQVLASAKIPCEISTDIRRAMWRKLVWNAAFCAIACLTRTTVKNIVESESLTKLAVDCMAEVLEAAKIEGFAFQPAVIDETLAFSKTVGDFKPSMLQDLEAGKPLEYEAFNGIVLKTLRPLGIKAPTNQIFYGTLKYLDQRIRGRA